MRLGYIPILFLVLLLLLLELRYNRIFPKREKPYHKALKVSENIINNENIKRAKYYHELGVLNYFQFEYDEAIENYNKAIELNPNDEEIYFSRSNAYYVQGHYDKAAKDYNTAMTLISKRVDANFKKLEEI